MLNDPFHRSEWHGMVRNNHIRVRRLPSGDVAGTERGAELFLSCDLGRVDGGQYLFNFLQLSNNPSG